MLILVHFFVLRLPIVLALVVIVINCLLNSLITMYVIFLVGVLSILGIVYQLILIFHLLLGLKLL